MPNATIHTGDALAVLLTLPSSSVDCIVTSPPFYRQRDYGTAEWSGGSPDCDHKPTRKGPHTRADCTLCGATRLDFQLGVESTPSAYIAALTGVLEAARRVLKPSGTLWLNLGDTYSGGGRGQTPGPASAIGGKAQTAGYLGRLEIENVAAKQLLGIPWRVALALQDAGWWLRADIIWHKPNPLPESVRDRPTSAHEYLFLLAKSERYYYDWEAVAEPLGGRPRTTTPAQRAAAKYADGTPGSAGRMQGPRFSGDTDGPKRRQRDVWTIPTRAFNAVREGLADTDHYAVMPDALVRPAILASTSERGVCPRCGEPWVRHTEQTPKDPGRAKGDLYIAQAYTTPQSKPSGKDRNLAGDHRPITTIGWRPACVCHLPPIPATVLDPFCGAATVGKVALEEGRDFIGIELNPAYADLGRRRLERVEG